MKKEQRINRNKAVLEAVANSPEQNGFKFVNTALLPSLSVVLNEIQIQSNLLRKAMESASPIIHQIFPMIPGTTFVSNKPGDLIKQNREV